MANAAARVLIVDDNADAALVLAKVLRKAGFEVADVGDHNTALATLHNEAEPVGAVISSFSVAGSAASLKLLDAVRSGRDPQVNQTRLMIITDQPRQQIFAWQAGADEIVMRPYHATSIAGLVTDMVRRADAERVAYRRERIARAKAKASDGVAAASRRAPSFT